MKGLDIDFSNNLDPHRSLKIKAEVDAMYAVREFAEMVEACIKSSYDKEQ